MLQNLQYLKKTAAALQELNQAASDLDVSADAEVLQQQALKQTVSSLKSELKEKAQRIDDIINTLNGALK